jgi:hypothetical protein
LARGLHPFDLPARHVNDRAAFCFKHIDIECKLLRVIEAKSGSTPLSVSGDAPAKRSSAITLATARGKPDAAEWSRSHVASGGALSEG